MGLVLLWGCFSFGVVSSVGLVCLWGCFVCGAVSSGKFGKVALFSSGM